MKSAEVKHAGPQGGGAAAAHAHAGPAAGRAVGRAAAAHGAGPRAGQGRRPGPARRAAGQPRLQAARGAARRAAALFTNRRCTVVLATSDPTEALLLGGHTAALHEGSVTQFGPTADIYRKPANVLTARVFSNPPINMAPVAVEKGDRGAQRHGEVAGPRRDAAPTATTPSGIRPHHIQPDRQRQGRGADRGAGPDRRDQRLRERHPLRARRAQLGVAVARRARHPGGRDGTLLHRRRALHVLRRRRKAESDGAHHLAEGAAQLSARSRQTRRTGRSSSSTSSGATAARTPCSALPAAARPRCSTSSPGWCGRPRGGCCSTAPT